MKKLKIHTICDIFPPMNEQEFTILCESIEREGLKKPIVLFESKILDGRNRYEACVKLKQTYDTVEFDATKEDPFTFVLRENLARRNLTGDSPALIAAELAEKIANWKPSGNGHSTPSKHTATVASTKKAAAAMGVTVSATHRAAQIRKADPEIAAEVKAGKTTLNKAVKKVRSAKDAKVSKSKEFEIALDVIKESYGDELTDQLKSGSLLKNADVVKLSRLPKEEMQRIRNPIAAGWKLKEAIDYQATALTAGHKIRDLMDRTVAQGGMFRLEIGNFIIDVQTRPSNETKHRNEAPRQEDDSVGESETLAQAGL